MDCPLVHACGQPHPPRPFSLPTSSSVEALAMAALMATISSGLGPLRIADGSASLSCAAACGPAHATSPLSAPGSACSMQQQQQPAALRDTLQQQEPASMVAGATQGQALCTRPAMPSLGRQRWPGCALITSASSSSGSNVAAPCACAASAVPNSRAASSRSWPAQGRNGSGCRAESQMPCAAGALLASLATPRL